MGGEIKSREKLKQNKTHVKTYLLHMTVQPKGNNVAIGERTFVTRSNRERTLGYKCGDRSTRKRLWVDYLQLRIYEDTL